MKEPIIRFQDILEAVRGYLPEADTAHLDAVLIEQTVWEHVQALLADPEGLRQQYEQGHGDPAIDVQAEHERARLERELTDQGQLLRTRVQE
ncbi:MAG: hypothetical protein ACWGSD_07755, partial [Thermodesulfobacteriota bacterium]